MPEDKPSPSARVPYVFPPPGTNDVADIIRERRGNRPLIDLDGVLLNAEPVAAGWNELGRGLRNSSTIPVDLRELLTLRVAVLNGSAYVWRAHEKLARAAGISTTILLHVRTAPKYAHDGRTDVLDPLFAAALLYADYVNCDVRVPKEVYDRLRALLPDDRQMVEATAVVAGYNFTTRILRPLDAAGMADDEVPMPVDE
ncbi:carboxymuconolactone decarboxylase [Vararia minispora EC-137]|uniref:Carboxymuconolactone decarboxylase n=1 Tax=Vararia minispora EC-137 TaxID=1314806 RepID=A0ACB8QX63_9AGAM|nr:carboxymuconolactone decarboxylase [Vararia minispora EC-137]